ncbi:MAG: lipoyl synthase [Actinomycetota bacterium]
MPGDSIELGVVRAGLVDYSRSARWQDDLHSRRVASQIGDVLLLLEHNHVYTLGRRASREHLLFDDSELGRRGIALCEADRGGDITYHGPGQLIAYPIVNLKSENASYVDVVKYLRLLEAAIMRTFEKLGVRSERREGMTGVWSGKDKLAAIGVRVSRGIAKHGLAINVSTDLDYFNGIIACGLATEGVTSLEKVLKRPVSISEVSNLLIDELARLLDRKPVEKRLHDFNLAPPPKPAWLKTKIQTGPNFNELKGLVRGLNLHTVCEEARCPNIYECWESREATFLILGEQCTRRCGFCDIATGKPGRLDSEEPVRVAQAVAAMGLKFAVVTGVERDDVAPSKVAEIWAATIRAIRERIPLCRVEVLTGDLKGDANALAIVLDAGPDVFAHNLETVPRLHPKVRPGFRYERSLQVLAAAKQIRPDIPAKSNLILGLGETPSEIESTLSDLRSAGVELVTIGQYLAPSATHLPVRRWVAPEEFETYKQLGEKLGFAWVESGPLVRSSYKAGRQFEAATARMRNALTGAP